MFVSSKAIKACPLLNKTVTELLQVNGMVCVQLHCVQNNLCQILLVQIF